MREGREGREGEKGGALTATPNTLAFTHSPPNTPSLPLHPDAQTIAPFAQLPFDGFFFSLAWFLPRAGYFFLLPKFLPRSLLPDSPSPTATYPETTTPSPPPPMAWS